MGTPIFKNVLDAWIYQEIIYEIQPDVIIEIGSGYGGSTKYFANLLDMLDKGEVISIDIDRSIYNAGHKRITALTGSSSAPEIVAKVARLCENKTVLLIQDGGHSRQQVSEDLENYSKFISLNSYFIVEDGIVDLFHYGDSLGFQEDGPLVAVEEFLRHHPEFEIDSVRERYLLTYNPKGFLKRISQGHVGDMPSEGDSIHNFKNMLSGDVKKISPTGEPVLKFFNPIQIIIHLWQYRDLIRQLTWREVAGRYRGSFIGLGWSFIHPLIMLSVYTFVFSEVFKAKWGMEPNEGVTAFGLALFMGLITFNIFSEVISSAPSLILAHTSYVKKVVFPLEILVVVKFLSALINALFSLSVLIIGFLILNHFIHLTIVILPVIWLPMMMFTLGCGYFLASLGVFVRDLGTSVGIVISMLFFLTPIFYPARAVPEAFRFICLINPMAVFIEDSRKAVLWGLFPDWQWFLLGLFLSLAIFILGFLWFMKTKKAFADVI